MTKSIDVKAGTPRALPKEVRRKQLIHATMASIAENGLSGTTMATVTQKAGLSMGIANLHFKSKEKMLTETMQYLTDEYSKGQMDILASQKYSSVADKIQAVLAFDLNPKLLHRNKLAVWVAFWGEAKARPTYQRIRKLADIESEKALGDLFQAAIDEGDYTNTDADLLARGYIALIDGLWLNLLVAPKQFTRSKAKKIAHHYLASAFPKHIQLSDRNSL